MARASSMPPRLFQYRRRDPADRDDLPLGKRSCAVLVEIAVVAGVMWLCAPGDGRGRSASDLGVDSESDVAAPPSQGDAPGDYLEHSPILLLPIVISVSRIRRARRRASHDVSEALNAIDFNTINLFLLMLGALLHWTPARLLTAFREATPSGVGNAPAVPVLRGHLRRDDGHAAFGRDRDVFVRASSPTCTQRSSSCIRRRSACSCRPAAPSG